MVSVIAANRFVTSHENHGLRFVASFAASIDFFTYVLYANVNMMTLAANDFMLIV